MRSSVSRCRIAVPCSSGGIVFVVRCRARRAVSCSSGGIVCVFRCCVSRIMESYRSVVLRIVLRCRYAVSDALHSFRPLTAVPLIGSANDAFSLQHRMP